MSSTKAQNPLRSTLVLDDELDSGPRSHPLVDVSVDSDEDVKSPRKSTATPPLSSPSGSSASSSSSSSSSSGSSAFRSRLHSSSDAGFAQMNENGELHTGNSWGWASRAWNNVSGKVSHWGRTVMQMSGATTRQPSNSVDDNPLIASSGPSGGNDGGVAPVDDDSDEAIRQRASQSDEVVIINNVHKTYLLGIEGVPALRGVSLRIRRGEFLVILGSSGGGKTSLLNLIGSIDRPTKGEIIICGERLTSSTPDEVLANLRLTHLGFVFQTFNLISSMTAFENVCLPMILKAEMTPKEIESRAKELLTRVGLGNRMDHLPSQLSGGEQQRVTIARALANRPSLLLLDEPTGDLDTKNSVIILSLLLHLNRFEEISCIMVTHDQSLSLYGHRIVNMLDGKIVRITHTTEESRKNAELELSEKLALLQRQQREKDAANANNNNVPVTPGKDNSIQQLEALHNDWMSWSGHSSSTPAPADSRKHSEASMRREEEEKKKSVEDSRAIVADGYSRTEIRNPEKYYSFLLQE